MREAAKPALEKLDELGIKYYYYEHPLAKTMEDCEGIGADVGAKHFKNIYACDHTETNFFIIIIRADKKFRTSEVSRKLGVSRLSFCTDEMLEENLGVVSGAVTPLALMNDKEHKTLLVVDKDILRDEMVCCHQRRYRGHAPLRPDQVRPGLRQRDKVPRHRRRRSH